MTLRPDKNQQENAFPNNSKNNTSIYSAKKKLKRLQYCKDAEPLYHSFICSLVSLLYGTHALPAMQSLLVTLYVKEYLIGTNQRFIKWQPCQVSK